VEIESSVPDQVGPAHRLGTSSRAPPRTPNFGYGQAVLYDTRTGVKFGASDPRHDEKPSRSRPAFDSAPARRTGTISWLRLAAVQ